MKQAKVLILFVCTFSLLILSSFAQNEVEPKLILSNQDIFCEIPGTNPNLYIFQWTLDDKLSEITSNKVSASKTLPLQKWSCKVFMPPTQYLGMTLIREAAFKIINSPPFVIIALNQTTFEKKEINFTASASDPIDNDAIISWSWDFGDGSKSNIQNPSHTYSINGTFDVSVVVKDSYGATASDSRQIIVGDQVPYANFIASATTIPEGNSVTFTDTSISYETIVNWLWNFGDGNTATNQNPTHFFADNGIFNVSLNVTDFDGSVSKKTKLITVTDLVPLFVDFNASTYLALVNQVISFNDLSKSAPDSLIYWNWTFGDSKSVLMQNTTHKYSVPGMFSVRLRVRDDDNSFNMRTKLITVVNCISDSDCDDSNPTTIDTCISKATTQSYCVSGLENLHGTIINTNSGVAIPYANISFYSNKTCNLDELTLDESGSCTLNPKSKPDVIANSFGNYSVYLPQGFYQMVIKHSRQADRNVFVNDSDDKKHDSEMKENPAKNVNFEGHIRYAGKNEGNNKYVIGDNLEFTMFGVNQEAVPVTVSFMIERHADGVDTGSNGPWVYNGSFFDVNQVLTVPNGAMKVSKKFTVRLPSSLNPIGAKTRYDIHVLYYNGVSYEKWHKIGNFFIVPRTVPPETKFEGYSNSTTKINKGQYVNQSFNVSFKVEIPPETDSIADQLIHILPIFHNNCYLGATGDEITVLAPGALIDLNGTSANDVLKVNITNGNVLGGCYIDTKFTYSKSDKFKINMTFKEQTSGLSSSAKYVNVSVWATEQQARTIYYDITQIDIGGVRSLDTFMNCSTNCTGFYAGDHCSGTGGYCADSILDVFRFFAGGSENLTADLFSTSMGFEYRTTGDVLDVTDVEKNYLNTQWQSDTPDYILVADPMTTKDLAQTIKNFAEFIVITKGHSSP